MPEVAALFQKKNCKCDSSVFSASILSALAENTALQEAATIMSSSCSKRKADDSIILIKSFNIDEALISVLSCRTQSVRAFCIWLPPDSTGHLWQYRTYGSIVLEYRWPHMENDAWITVKDYRKCTKRFNAINKSQYADLFRRTSLLEFVPSYILGLPSWNTNRNKYVVTIAERYLKLAWEFPSQERHVLWSENYFLQVSNSLLHLYHLTNR